MGLILYVILHNDQQQIILQELLDIARVESLSTDNNEIEVSPDIVFLYILIDFDQIKYFFLLTHLVYLNKIMKF